MTNKKNNMKMDFDRRKFLGWSAASLTAAGIWGMPGFLRRSLAGQAGSDKKVLFIFLRGGMDAVQCVIPHGDSGLPDKPGYAAARPTLGVDAADSHDLNGFCSFHPAMQDETPTGPKLADIFHGNVDERGQHLAVIHRVGYESQNRSHFSSQQFWENGVPGAVNLEEGVFNRYIDNYPDVNSPLQAATLNTNQVVLMKGPRLIPVMRSVNDYALPSNVDLGSFPTLPDPRGRGLKGAYGQIGFPARPANRLTYATGTALLESLQFFEDNVHGVPYEPEPDAQPYYAAMTDGAFRNYLRDCARLLKQVDSLQITGCNQNGYDTHGRENVVFPNLMRNLSLGLTALYHDLKPIWEKTIVFTLTEFGRTSMQNANFGTDHGESTCTLLMGGPINGGVRNCDASTWADGDLFSTANGRYVQHQSDFRRIYAHLIQDHLGDSDTRIDEIIPGYSQAQQSDSQGYFDSLNLIGA